VQSGMAAPQVQEVPVEIIITLIINLTLSILSAEVQ
jgi:hypothetical protein